MSELKRVYVDLGGWSNGIFYPMTVIDAHPKVWKDKVTGSFVPPENWERFKPYIEEQCLRDYYKDQNP